MSTEEKCKKKIAVFLTEEMVLNYSALPPELDGWRRYRVEYGGVNGLCVLEETIYLPESLDPRKIEKLIHDHQPMVNSHQKEGRR